MSKPASGRTAAKRERDLRFDRRSTRGSAVRVDRRRLDRSRSAKRAFRFSTRAAPRLSRLADYFASIDLTAFAASFYRFAPKYPFIPNGLRFDLSTAFRRGASDSSRRRPDRRNADFRRERRRWKTLKNVWKRGKGACDSRRQGNLRNESENGRRLDFDATTRETWFRKSLRDAELREAAAAKERANTGLLDATSSFRWELGEVARTAAKTSKRRRDFVSRRVSKALFRPSGKPGGPSKNALETFKPRRLSLRVWFGRFVFCGRAPKRSTRAEFRRVAEERND